MNPAVRVCGGRSWVGDGRGVPTGGVQVVCGGVGHRSRPSSVMFTKSNVSVCEQEGNGMVVKRVVQ